MADIFSMPSTTPSTTRAGGQELEADTHGMIVSGALATTAIETTLGQVTLPAGGPWNIFGIHASVVRAVGTPDQAIAGHFRLNAASGDITPNPAPSRFPLSMSGSSLGGTMDVACVPLQIYPVDYKAPGKAIIDLIIGQAVAAATAPQAVMGIIFGKTVPQTRPFVFVDRVRALVNAAVDTAIGTITLAEKATLITAICGIATQSGVLTTAEELIGQFRISSDDIKMAPAAYPLSAAFSAGLGALIGNDTPAMPVWIPVNIPVVGGTRVDCFVDFNTALTNTADVEIFVAYE